MNVQQIFLSDTRLSPRLMMKRCAKDIKHDGKSATQIEADITRPFTCARYSEKYTKFQQLMSCVKFYDDVVSNVRPSDYEDMKVHLTEAFKLGLSKVVDVHNKKLPAIFSACLGVPTITLKDYVDNVADEDDEDRVTKEEVAELLLSHYLLIRDKSSTSH
jgi:hypothetical protein